MNELYATGIFLFAMFALLGGSVWVGLALVGVAFIGMELFTSRPQKNTSLASCVAAPSRVASPCAIQPRWWLSIVISLFAAIA